ncbi:12683_t:CDS:1 [Gigaspora margarita]|uniref:12683_t:CDS:1 n=1 Tax=Gigaspora margarita TaxID=4874 RepID=A0ABN7UY88_GIGMA|nr:12683_t:CDS:1 [Gigaspora margarita]
MNRIDDQTKLDSNNNNENDQYEELREELIFYDWNLIVNKVDKYERRQGFKMRYYYVQKLKSGDIQRCTIVCEYFGTKSKDLNKETIFKCIEYTWQINLLCSERKIPNKIVYVAKLVNKHKNYELDLAYYNFYNNIAFTTEMTKDIEFFVKKMNCNSQQIHRSIEEKYFVKIYIQVLRLIIQQFHPKLYNQTNNASRLYEELLSKKNADSQ